MKIALMQPYFMPYLGYFQLIAAVDKFIFFDDARFIKQGFIHRNNILLDGKRHRFGLPIQHISSSKTIKDTLISEKPDGWQRILNKKFWLAYHKAPFFDAVFPFVAEILRGAAQRSIADVAIESIEKTLNYIGFRQNTARSSEHFADSAHLKVVERIAAICQKEGATTYLNASGGQAFLHKDDFKNYGIDLVFIKPILKNYAQSAPNFVAGLSILDVLMHNDPSVIKGMLNDFNQF